ncbi:hypothetical protein FNW02_35495 [Komarekiella sp. 'clone 1']|uniref:Uncharacterized protein n=1 Tax=Komarekiella delphini-convector SJRDD-AB1 TaxID=2593771 RepID=A0AA40VV74_9NOST|nr:hypothetical protein [Komarekiella delphini-convector SJRDD-AB1]
MKSPLVGIKSSRSPNPLQKGAFDSGSPLFKGSQRGLLPKGEASAKGVSPMSDWRGLGGI